MLTGDCKQSAEAVADELGIDEVHAKLLLIVKVPRAEELIHVKENVTITVKQSF